MSTQRIAVLGLTGLLMLAGLPTAEADARRKGLRVGAEGPFVKILQTNLTRAGFSTAVDGQFGPGTRSSLMSWERWRHRRVDGVATRRDRRALRRSARFGTRRLRIGMEGRDVRGLQWHLGRVGYGTSVDGAFGPLTQTAVRRWEGARGRRVDGVATRADQQALRHTRRSRTRAPSPRVRRLDLPSRLRPHLARRAEQGSPAHPRRQPDRQDAVQVRRRARDVERLGLRLLRLCELRPAPRGPAQRTRAPVGRVHELALRRPREVGHGLRAQRTHVPDGRRPPLRYDRPRARRDPLAPRHALDSGLRGAPPRRDRPNPRRE